MLPSTRTRASGAAIDAKLRILRKVTAPSGSLERRIVGPTQGGTMASIRKADYYTMKVSQRPGAGARLLAAMKAAGVNLLAFTGFPTGGGAQVDFIPENGAKFRQVAKKAGL